MSDGIEGHKVFVSDCGGAFIEMVNDEQPIVRMGMPLSDEDAREIADSLLAAAGRPGVIIKREHGGGEIPDYHDPVWLGGSVNRDKLGRRHPHGWTRFVVVRCNNPGCKYEALINAEEIVKHL